MSRPFAVFDVDGTLIRWQLFHALVDGLAKNNLIAPDGYQRIREARMVWKRRGHDEAFNAYEHLMVEVFDASLQQVSPAQWQAIIEQVFDEYKDQTYQYTRRLVKDLKQQGYMLFAISGSPVDFITRLAAHYGFDDWVGAEYEVIDGSFSGKKEVPVGRKDQVLQQLVEKHGLTFKDSIAVGDSAGDISMLEMVEKPMAFNPESKLYEHAKTKGWPIIIERKNVIYELKIENAAYQLS